MKAMLASNACVFLHTGSDAKVFISTLVNKMQKWLVSLTSFKFLQVLKYYEHSMMMHHKISEILKD